MLTQIIKVAKCMQFKKLIAEFDNKVKTAWKIVKRETGKQPADTESPPIKINHNITINKMTGYGLDRWGLIPGRGKSLLKY
jgi:hypothetical protein